MNWDEVVEWDIENNEIMFYDKNGNLITSAFLDDIIDTYIEVMRDLAKGV